MHGVAVYLKEVLSFAQELFLENSANYYLCFQLALLDSASYFFFLIRSHLCLYEQFLVLFHLT